MESDVRWHVIGTISFETFGTDEFTLIFVNPKMILQVGMDFWCFILKSVLAG